MSSESRPAPSLSDGASTYNIGKILIINFIKIEKYAETIISAQSNCRLLGKLKFYYRTIVGKIIAKSGSIGSSSCYSGSSSSSSFV